MLPSRHLHASLFAQLAAAERERDRLSAQLNELRKTYEEDKREILAFGREAAAVPRRWHVRRRSMRR